MILDFRITEFRGKKFSRLREIECNKMAEETVERNWNVYNEIKVCPKDVEYITYSNKIRSLKSQYDKRRESRKKTTTHTVWKSNTDGTLLKLDMKRFVWSSWPTGFDNIENIKYRERFEQIEGETLNTKPIKKQSCSVRQLYQK